MATNPDFDLHAYSNTGEHVGMNYLTGGYETEIDGSRTSGNILNGGPEWISLPDDVQAHFPLDATPAGEWVEELGADSFSIEAEIQAVFFNAEGDMTETESVIVPIDLDEPVEFTVEDGEIKLPSEEGLQFPCFIATAAYDTPVADEIQILREFRDGYLLTNPLGQALVYFYYWVSPPLAEFITEYPSLKPIVRTVLVPAVTMSAVVVDTTAAEKTVIMGLLVLVSVVVAIRTTRRRNRGSEHL
jgi:hypothetical protein